MCLQWSSSGRGRTSSERGLILFDPNKPCAAAIEPASESSENGPEMSEASRSRGPERENETINDVRVSGDELCLLETGNPSGTSEMSEASGSRGTERENETK
jgi:hypothetical protein